MPYKVSLRGKSKFSGKLAEWVEAFHAYHAADFPPGTPRRLYFVNYVAAMTDLFARYCDRKWFRGAGSNYYLDLCTHRHIWDDAKKKGDLDVLDIPMYHLLDFMAERIPGEEFSETARRFRRLIISWRPDFARQVVQWDTAIAALLAAEAGDQQAEAALDQVISTFRDSPDWGMLAARLRRLRAHDTGPDLLSGLDELDAVVITRALAARDGEINIQANLWPAIQFGILLGDLVAAANDESGAAERVRQALAELAQDPDRTPLGAALGRILDGERAPGLVSQLSDPFHQAVVATVLHYLDTGPRTDIGDGLCSARVVFDLVAQDELGAGIAGLGRVELGEEGGDGAGAPGCGERVERIHGRCARPGRPAARARRAGRIRARPA
jgi:hypothetical protein